MKFKERIKNFYIKQNKKFMIFTVCLILLSIITLGVQKINTGSFIKKDVTLKGGISLRFAVDSNFNIEDFSSKFSSKYKDSVLLIREIQENGKLSSVVLEASDIDDDALIKFSKEYIGHELKDFSKQDSGPKISSEFFKQTITAVFIALIFMGIVVLITFRNLVPSLFVILAAVSTLITTMAVTVLLNIQLSSAGIAAFLMLIGYSVDTDILLTTRVLKRQEGGELYDKIFSAMRTGLILTLTSFGAVMSAYIFSESDVISQITLILSIGLFFDIIYTWLQNAVILRIYMEKKHNKNE